MAKSKFAFYTPLQIRDMDGVRSYFPDYKDGEYPNRDFMYTVRSISHAVYRSLLLSTTITLRKSFRRLLETGIQLIRTRREMSTYKSLKTFSEFLKRAAG